MSLMITQVDAFTDEAFGGNPAAVCLLPEERDAGWMQKVAREMNLSETAFLLKQEDGFGLRWFTPVIEVDLCGHATLASAHVLWEMGVLGAAEQARFHTRSGLLTAKRRGSWIELDFPMKEEEPADAPARLAEALGVTPKYVGTNKLDYLVEVEEEEVREMRPDFTLLKAISARGIMVTAESADPRYDFISRFFAPAAGIDEDPVTGSAHTALTPFWAKRLGKNTMMAHQASERGGVLRVAMAGDRVLIEGQAVTVMRGEFFA